MSLEQAIALATGAEGAAHPNPTVGAVVVSDNAIVGSGVTEASGGRHAEIVALAEAGERASGATLFVTMEPCAHHGRTPPCVEAIAAAGIAKVVAGSRDPNPKAAHGLERLRAAGVAVELDERPETMRLNEAWRTWVTSGRPFVTLKLAVSLDGRVVVPGRRWVTGEAARRCVHELRARSDAVGVGMGTVRADDPGLDARGTPGARQPRRIAFGQGPLPPESELELHAGPLEQVLRTLGDEGVQSLLVEGGPTIAGSLVDEGLVDRILVFVAPVLAGHGPQLLGELVRPVQLADLRAEQVGDDILLRAELIAPAG